MKSKVLNAPGMLPQLFLWFSLCLGVVSSSMQDLQLTNDNDQVDVNITQNASLVWRYTVDSGDYVLLWGLKNPKEWHIETIFFVKTDKNSKPQPMSSIPQSYKGRVQMIGIATLHISAVTLDDEGDYMCELRGAVRTVKKKITLVVIVPPKIKTSPWQSKVTIEEGKKYILSCQADGKPKPLVIWRKDGKTVQQGRSKLELTLDPVNYKDRGNYECLAVNKGGTEERKVNLIVQYKPKETTIKTNAKQDTIDDGSTIVITCTTTANPTAKYRFYRKAPGHNEVQLNNREAQMKGKLKVTVLHKMQRGIYACVPYNDYGDGPRAEVTVYVRYAPRITTEPTKNNRLEEGDPLSLQCRAEGYPPPNITWTHLTGNKIVGHGESYRIYSARKKDTGTYACAASNGFGQAHRVFFSITVYYAPEINKNSSSQNVPAFPGYAVNLTCNADGDPPPKYIWSNSSGVVFESESQELGRTLKVTPYPGSFGPYTCKVENSLGSDSLYINLEKVGKPVVQLQIDRREPTVLSFKLKVLKGRNDIRFLMLKYSSNDGREWDEKKISPPKEKFDLENLQPYTEYKVRLTATTRYFKSDFHELKVSTIEGVPSPPIGVIATALNATAVSVKWKRPVRPNGVVQYYTVNYVESSKYGLSSMTPSTVPHNVTKTILTGLKPFTNYSLQVRIQTSCCKKDSSLVRVKTDAAGPSAPEEFVANLSDEHATHLVWRKPTNINGPVFKFKIKSLWRVRDQNIIHENITIIPAQVTITSRRRARREVASFIVWKIGPYREIEIKDLKPYTSFLIRVAEGTKGFNNKVLWGPYSNSQKIETLEGAPSAPRNVRVYTKGETSLRIRWNRPKDPNGNITKYRIIYSNTTGQQYVVEIVKHLKNLTLVYTLKDLQKKTNYNIKVQAFTSRGSGVFSKSIKMKTGPLAVVSNPTTRALEPKVDKQQGGIDAGSLFGGVFAGIIVLAFAIIIVVLFVRNQKKKQDSTELKGNRCAVANSNDSGLGEKESLDMPSIKYATGHRRGSEDVIGPGGFATIKPIPVDKLREYCEINHADRNKAFREEFVAIRVPGNFTWEQAQKPENKAKNRYANIIPYDHSRVVLSEVRGVAGSDYINANFIDGYNHHYKFIATQGPVASTFSDFWRMVWEQRVCVIVMVTNVVERGRIKCVKYWPSTESETYGSITVCPGEEEELADYVIRKLTIQMNSSTEEFPIREVIQFHFTAWPDHGVPSHATSLLAFLRKVRKSVPEDAGPIVIHCSAGVGRSGTFIVLDAMLDQMAAEGVVDVCGFVSHIRAQRSTMVQTDAQYIFIHDALSEAVTCGTTEFSVRDLTDRLRVLNSVVPDSGKSLMVGEFMNLDLGESDAETFVSASMPENKTKNRYAILPYDRTRVKLWPYSGIIGSDYINASFVDSYQQREAFIATQAPLGGTVGDFLRTVWEYESHTIVMLTTPQENEEGLCTWYLPQREEFVMYGLLMLEVESVEMRNGYCRRLLKVTNTKSGEVRNCHHFHFLDWPERGIPRNGVGLIDMIKQIARAQQQTGNGPTTVHCSDGSGRTGTFCAISIALERARLEGTVDMFQNVRRLRTQRPLMVQTAEQYQFCYDMVRLFVDSCNDYVNFR